MFRGKGLARAFLLHASGDQAVPPTHGQQLAANLAAQGVPVTAYVVTTSMQGRACAGAWQGAPNQCATLPQPAPLPVPHALPGYGVVLAKARGDPDLAVPFAEGVFEVTTGAIVPAP